MANHQHDLTVLDNVLSTHGLCRGTGNGKTSFCAEQLVSLVCGLPITDQPDECVTPAVSAFGRRLNDSRWADDKARAEGMRPFLIAQIGSKGVVDGQEFAKRMALKTINRVLPLWLRNAKFDEKLVVACEQAKTLEEGHAAAVAARKVARDAADAAAYAADAAAYAAYADAAYADAAYADAADAIRAKTLPLSASIAVEVLRELKSPGCEYLT